MSEFQSKLFSNISIGSQNDCFKLNLIGLVLIFIFVTGIFFNSVLLWAFHVKKELLKIGPNIIVATLVVNNLFGLLFELPFVILNAFFCR